MKKINANWLLPIILVGISLIIGIFLTKNIVTKPQQKENEITAQKEPVHQKQDMSKLALSKPEYTSSSTQNQVGMPPKPQQKTQPIRVEKKVGRNDVCPCGSGKKYKQCHGKLD